MTHPSDRKELIEEAAKAIHYAFLAGGGYRGGAKAALAVFQKAHTPTDDERDRKHAECCGCDLPGCEFMAGWIEREKLTEPQGEPSDAQVQAAYRAHIEARMGRSLHDAEFEATRSRVEIEWLRAALRAAGGAR